MTTPAPGPSAASTPTPPRRELNLSLRRPVPLWQAVMLGLSCVALVLVAWWFVTRGETGEERLVGPLTLPSPAETIAVYPELHLEGDLNRNIVTTLRRVTLGFLGALAVGV